MWWWKIPVLLVVATANQLSLSDQRIARLRSRWSFVGWFVFASKAFFWTLTAFEVTLIWSVNHLRSPIAHRFLVFIVHPCANFPPNLHTSLPFAVVWSITLLSLATSLTSESYYRRVRQSAASSIDHQVRNASGGSVLTARRILLGSSPVMAIGSTMCYVLPGSFPYECWVWRMRLGGPLFCFMELASVVFWVVVIVWRWVQSRRGGVGLGRVEESACSDISLEECAEVQVVESDDRCVIAGAWVMYSQCGDGDV